DVTIDLTQVYFTDFYPATGRWINTLRPTCSILVHDDLTGVDPLSIEYEVTTSSAGSAGFTNEWSSILESYAPGEELRIVVSGWFKNGKDNWIRFRAKDVAGNPYMESDAYNVWVDAKAPTFKLVSQTEDEYLLDTLQEVRIQIEDEQAGVDASSIEYRLTTQGLTKWSQWMPYKDAQDGLKPTITIREHFRRGDQNYIQVRAKDLAGNPVAVSKAFNIKINTFPQIIVISPSSGDELYTDMDILFDASPSFDPDGDRITISWWISSDQGQVSLGDSQQIKANINEPGEYTITVVAKDRMNNEVQYFFTIVVNDPEEPEDDILIDTDADGMPDIWEERWKLNPQQKDATEDPDLDLFTNIEEYQNNTNPRNPDSHPPIRDVTADGDEKLSLFSQDAWPLWVLVLLLVVAIVMTMLILKGKQDKATSRIRTVRNMRRIMPSVSWDQITTTAYMAPMVQGGVLPAVVGPALPTSPIDLTMQHAALPAASEAALTENQPAAAPVGTYDYSPPQQ
ncbi:MAG: Ig-like domain-containing protein, partial [Thermoplasmatota archaeon]